jgi:tRNA(Ile)-lysidine synthase
LLTKLAANGEAISPERIAALLAPLERAKGILVAVSGGPDSTALLLMAARWAAQNNRPKIEVATVDHAMRAGSADEAEAVARLARRLGLTHHLLVWRGEKPRSRIQERAREARYALLATCARETGADFLVTAHHADDQAETVLFRLLRGSGIAGLKGMDSLTPMDGLTLARPLLDLAKAELVAFCAACGETFAQDPSNADPRFARTRLRRLSGVLAAEGLGPAEIARLSRRAARMETAVAAQTKSAAERLGWTHPEARRDARALFEEPMEIVLRLLRGEVARVAGKTTREIRLDQIETLAEALGDALGESKPMRANIGGVGLRLSVDGALTFGPEAPRKGRRPAHAQ